jgi:lysozyme
LIDQLKIHEGYRKHCYKDTKGVDTIGYGYNLKANIIELSSIEIAYFYSNGMTKEEAERILKCCIEQCRKTLNEEFFWFNVLAPARQDVLINMVYNIGLTRLNKFVKMIAFIEKEDWVGAAGEMLDSKWHKDVGQRAITLSAQMVRNTYKIENL